MTSTIKVNTVTTESGSTLTLGESGKTIALASGASQTGFGRTGTVDWQTTPKTGDFTAVNGEGYFVNTTSGTITMTMPSGSAGAIVSIQDYNKTFDDNNFTIAPASGEIINGGIAGDSLVINQEGQGLTFVYVDGTVGWKTVQDNDFTTGGGSFMTATGGTTTEDGDCKIHTFTGPGTFTVSGVSSSADRNLVSYMVVGGGGGSQEGAGGAGGYRELKSPLTPYTASPLDGYPTPGNRITVTATGFPITVGAGGAVGTPSPNPQPPTSTGQPGSNSQFSTIIGAGGGGGGKYTNNPNDRNAGLPGGSGGGSAAHANPAPKTAGGTGNTPPTTPSQGNNGGPSNGGFPNFAGGGGGAGGVGTTGSSGSGAPGGAGVTSSITGSAVGRAGGGGGGIPAPQGNSPSPGFGGGQGACTPSSGGATGGTANTGGGGGGTWSAPGTTGGSGIVVIRYRFK